MYDAHIFTRKFCILLYSFPLLLAKHMLYFTRTLAKEIQFPERTWQDQEANKLCDKAMQHVGYLFCSTALLDVRDKDTLPNLGMFAFDYHDTQPLNSLQPMRNTQSCHTPHDVLQHKAACTDKLTLCVCTVCLLSACVTHACYCDGCTHGLPVG